MHFNEDDITDVQATITGPAGTPYEGGHFRMKIVLGENFPSNPPKVRNAACTLPCARQP